MAVFDDYVDSNLAAGNRTSAIAAQGSKTVSGRVVFDTVAAHDANSVYRVLRGIPNTAVFKKFDIYTDGVTGLSDVNVGVYKVGAGAAVVDDNCLGDAIDLSSAVLPTAAKDGLISVVNSDRSKALWELAGQSLTSRQSHYDVCLTAIADPSEADTIVIDYEYWAP